MRSLIMIENIENGIIELIIDYANNDKTIPFKIFNKMLLL